jgi:hypothetical protein
MSVAGGSGPPDSGGASATVEVSVAVELHGATPAARVEFQAAVRAYADVLAGESQKQEISLRPPGAQNLEITANAVLMARRAMSRFGERAKPLKSDYLALVGAPTFSGAAGVMGSFLHSSLQVGIFIALALVATLCVCYLAIRRQP